MKTPLLTPFAAIATPLLTEVLTLKTIRIFLLRTDVRTIHGQPPKRTKNGATFKARKSKLVSHPDVNLFFAPDNFDIIGERCLYWHWTETHQDAPAMFCVNGVLRNAAQNFQGSSQELVAATWEAIRQRQFYLGDTSPRADDCADIELTPFNEAVPEDIARASRLPLKVIKDFFARSERAGREAFLQGAGCSCE